MSRKDDVLRLLAEGYDNVPAMAKKLGLKHPDRLGAAIRALVRERRVVQVEKDHGNKAAKYALSSAAQCTAQQEKP